MRISAAFFNLFPKRSAQECWSQLFRQQELWTSLVGEGPIVWDAALRETLFCSLYDDLKEILETVRDTEWEKALNELKQGLLLKLHFKNEQAKLIFSGDFEVYAYFLKVDLTPLGREVPVLPFTELWDGVVEAPPPCYQEVVCCLLKRLMVDLSEGRSSKDFTSLKKSLQRFESLSRLYGVSQGAPQVGLESVRGSFKQWFVELVSWLRALGSSKEALEDKEYINVVDKMWHILYGFGLEDDESYQEVKKHIHSCYHAVAVQNAKEYRTSSPSALSQIKSLLPGGEIRESIGKLQKDLKHLVKWSIYEAKANLLWIDEPNQASAYLALRQTIQVRFQQLSEEAYAIRERQEEKLRKEPDYLSVLNKLDEKLTEFERQLNKGREEWMLEVEKQYPRDDFYKRANHCFRALNCEAVRELERIIWVYHTAYGWERTEKCLAFEMNARNQAWAPRKFESYQLKTTITLSDYVVSNVGSYWQKARRVSLNVHPDKVELPGDKKELAIREACTRVLAELHDEAAMMVHMWQKSQWGGSSEETTKTPIYDLTPDDITRICKPKRGLDLSFLGAHQAYLNWAEKKSDLRKETHDVSYLHQFYPDDANNDLIRIIFESGKAIYLQAMKDIRKFNRIAAENKAEAGACKEEIKASKEELKAYREETTRLMRAAEEKKQQSRKAMNAYLIRELDKSFTGVVAPNPEWVREKFTFVVEEISQWFEEDKLKIEQRALDVIQTNEIFSHIRPVFANVVQQTLPQTGLSTLGTFAVTLTEEQQETHQALPVNARQ
jgi:hypothetical protein